MSDTSVARSKPVNYRWAGMCGICGVVQIGGEPRPAIAPDVLERMTDAMTHRGPDDGGTYLADGIALGVRRLSIVDVEGGHQPVFNEDGTVVAVQNGELYNHLDVRAALEPDGHRFRSRCDTEVLPHLYERHGVVLPTELRGKFAIAVWDERKRRLLLARDRLGVKPLYFGTAGDVLVFSSELKSLLASGLFTPELDYEAIDAYLTFGFVPAPRTVLAQVSKLLPGHRLVVEGGSVRIDPYWQFPEPAPESPARPPGEYAAELLELLEESVRLRLMSDVPLGAMLSGGLDSSLIVALMARNMSDPVKTFSVGFREDEDNELADARLVAEMFGADHHELELSLADSRLDLEQLVWALDEPLADLSALGFLQLSELASTHVTVALSGQGADELLAGYPKYRAAAMAQTWSRMPSLLRRTAERAAGHGTERARRAARILALDGGVDRIAAVWDTERLDPLRDPAGPLASGTGAARDAVDTRLGSYRGKPLAEILYVDAQLGLVDDMLHYFDRASMAHSLEVRVPFLDHHVVEYCARVPLELKMRRLTTKHLLKVAARDLLPSHVVDKRKIGFFHGAVSAWLAEQARTASDHYLLAGDAHYTEFLSRNEVARLVSEQELTRGHASSQLLLRLLILEVWLASFVPRAFGADEPTRAFAVETG